MTDCEQIAGLGCPDSSCLGFLSLRSRVQWYHSGSFDLDHDPFLSRTSTRILVRAKVLLRHPVNMRLRAVGSNLLDAATNYCNTRGSEGSVTVNAIFGFPQTFQLFWLPRRCRPRQGPPLAFKLNRQQAATPCREHCQSPLLKPALPSSVQAATWPWPTWVTSHSGPEERAGQLTFSSETGRSSERVFSTWTRSSVRTVEGFSSSQTRRPEIRSAKSSLDRQVSQGLSRLPRKPRMGKEGRRTLVAFIKWKLN